MQSLRLSQVEATTSTPGGSPNSEKLEFTEIERLNADLARLRDRFSRLTDAIIRISENLDFNALLQEAVECARSLTGAKYGVLLTYGADGAVANVISSGLSSEEISRVRNQPAGLGLLGYLNEIKEPLRISDISSHPRSIGFPENHPPMRSFLGMPIRHHGEHLGNIFLTEKEYGAEFSLEDEETLVMFATQAAHALSNARQYEEVQRAKADLETILRISPIGIAILDIKTGRILSFNDELARLFGGREIIESPWEETFPLLSFRRLDGKEISFAELPGNRVYQYGETIRAEELVVGLPDGRSVPILLNGAPIFSDDGEIEAAVFTFQDYTSLVDMERVRAEFLGMVSEELRMPLTTIKGSIAALADTVPASGRTEQLQLLRIINQQTDMMRSQVNSLVELTQITTGRLLISQETADISSLVKDAVKEFLSGHAGNPIEIDAPSDLPLVMADKQRVLQVLNNILFTVSRHTPELSGIHISAAVVDIYVAVSVSCGESNSYSLDESQQFLQKMWGTRSTEFPKIVGGEGLALGMCKGIVEAHGGRMRVENDGQMGAMNITFTLPAADESDQAVLSEFEGSPLSTDVRPIESPKILVAVSDAKISAAIRRHLPSQEYATVAIFDQSEIDQTLPRERPQLILLDLPGPEIEILHLTRRLSTTYGIPIVVLSDNDSDASVARALEWGAHDYVVKPFSPTELIARIKACLRKQAVSHGTNSPAVYTNGNVCIDYDARILTVRGAQVQLTATEYKLLYELSNNAGRVLTQDELLHRVWGPEYSGEPQLLRSYIKSVRQKLGDNARKPVYIFTEHGVGYRMAKA